MGYYFVANHLAALLMEPMTRDEVVAALVSLCQLGYVQCVDWNEKFFHFTSIVYLQHMLSLIPHDEVMATRLRLADYVVAAHHHVRCEADNHLSSSSVSTLLLSDRKAGKSSLGIRSGSRNGPRCAGAES